jgi:hypothetical protein
MGAGSMTGRGLGCCAGAVNDGVGMGRVIGMGLACRRAFRGGFGRGFAYGESAENPVVKQLEHLQKRLDAMEKQLEK